MQHVNCRSCSQPYRCKPGGSIALIALALLFLGALATGAAQDQRPNVLTTVAPLTNIVKNIGGPFIDLHGLIPGGMDSHTFEPVPADVKYVIAADLIILNGLDLETPTEKLGLAHKKSTALRLKLGDQTSTAQDYVYDRSFPKAGGHPNPHLWMNPIYAMRYSELVRDVLSALDPVHAAQYHQRTQQYS